MDSNSEINASRSQSPVIKSQSRKMGVRGRRGSSVRSPSSLSTMSLPSPSTLSARAYLLEQLTPINPSDKETQCRGSLQEFQEIPRRHSTLGTTASLAVRMRTLQYDDGSRCLSSQPKMEMVGTKFEPEQETGRAKRNGESILQPDSSPPQASVVPTSPSTEILCQVPFEYTHSHLRDWGHAYLGNVATADAFVKAISLRRPSITPVEEDVIDAHSKASAVTIRARVLPKTKERKPFLIQRQVDIDALRSAIPSISSDDHASPNAQSIKPQHQMQTRRSSTIHLRARRLSLDYNRGRKVRSLDKGAVPIHIEYALHYLPALAALMLSGHVRKGDSIDLPVPHPEAWPSVIAYIYIGQSEVTAEMRDNILYLAGNIASMQVTGS